MRPDPLPPALRPLTDNELAAGIACGVIALALLTLISACGGGGDSEPTNAGPKTPQADTEVLARFEYAPGVCAFDSSGAVQLAVDMFPVELDRCRVLLVGNTLNGQPEPARSWPSTPFLNHGGTV